MNPPRAEPELAVVEDSALYGPTFWLAYLANVLLVCANSITFHFAEFIADLGGTEVLSGQIVSVGLTAAVVMRLWLGRAIDRLGPRWVWQISSLAFIAGGLTFLLPGALSPLIWLARIGYQVGLAGMFSCSIVHIQNQAPPHRRTEVIGSLGSSGFVGTILGTQLGDLIFNHLPPGQPQYLAMFGGSVLLAVLHLGVVSHFTRRDVHTAPLETPGALKLLVRHWPGAIVLVAIAMGTGFSVTTVFLTRYATALNLRGIGTFFLAYSMTAFCCRWLFRRFGETAGRHRMVLWGLFGLTCGQWLFLCVTSDLLFILPALVCGFGHALLFPAVVSLGAGAFPVHYRGTGTTLVLGFTELGTIISAPLLGAIIDLGREAGSLEPGREFRRMFIVAGAVALVVAVIYALTAARRPDRDATPDDEVPFEVEPVSGAEGGLA